MPTFELQYIPDSRIGYANKYFTCDIQNHTLGTSKKTKKYILQQEKLVNISTIQFTFTCIGFIKSSMLSKSGSCNKCQSSPQETQQFYIMIMIFLPCKQIKKNFFGWHLTRYYKYNKRRTSKIKVNQEILFQRLQHGSNMKSNQNPQRYSNAMFDLSLIYYVVYLRLCIALYSLLTAHC